jgi:two-component system response regulator AtoC
MPQTTFRPLWLCFVESAVQAVRLGAYDYLTKPFSLGQTDVIVQRISERQALEAENRHLAHKVGSRGGTEPQGIATDRLDAIDARLTRIEELLGRIIAGRPRL